MRIPTLQRVLVIGLTWGVLWLAAAIAIGAVIGVVDPDSIDPGEGPIAVMILGSMGFLSGVAFGILLSLANPGAGVLGQSLPKTVLWGFLACAIVQLGYLDHGDAGLAANLQMALALCAFGGAITAAWLLIARGWASWRSSHSYRP